MEKMKIGIVYDETKKEAKRLAENVKKWLEKRGCQIFIEATNNKEDKEQFSNILGKLDFLITFAGDGGVLFWANEVAKRISRKLPILRVNFGKRGALTNIEPKDVFNKLKQVLNDNYIIVKRTRIQAAIVSKKNGTQRVLGDALNEVVIERRKAKTVYFKVVVAYNGKNAENFNRRGDNFIFATPTGSTAYAESAGGPTLIRKDKFILRVTAPTDRECLPYLITPNNVIFEVVEIEGETALVIDGEENIEKLELREDESVIISKSPKNSYFMEIGDVEKKPAF
ncbi:NAD(+)/NADH kinase [Candidatus Parcubacteria bacterium]|nr:NAD(+)/NADH kinase [Candidatus Parcubacteria bacterium]